MVIRTLETPSGILRLVAIVSSDVTRTLVFALQQSHAEAKRSQEGPPTSAGRDVPAFPGSQTVFTAADRRAKAELLVASTRAAPHAVRRFYHDHLTTSGWMPALPTGEGHIAGGVYLRDRTICYVQATAQATETHIAVLCKELSTKPEP